MFLQKDVEWGEEEKLSYDLLVLGSGDISLDTFSDVSDTITELQHVELGLNKRRRA